MTPAARFSAAIEVFSDIDRRRRPASDALKDWGLLHRFAGSSDRASVASLVYDALRRRASARWLMEDDGARATLIGTMVLQRNWDLDAVSSLCSGEKYAPDPLTLKERAAIETRRVDDAPAWIRADVPEWLWPHFEAAFGDAAMEEGRALGGRAPLDLRTNTLRSSRDKVLAELEPLGAASTPLSPLGLRIHPGADGRGASVQSEPSFQKGWFEIQDEGSQLAALLSGARPGELVLDLCAGGGGKTLQLAAMMGNKGQIFATDSDKRRLMPIYARLSRAGVRNVQVRPMRGEAALEDIAGRLDLVLVDAPCTGTGTWRRNPDAKWRVRPNSLATRIKEQAEVLETAASVLKPGGRIAYITCSLLPDENDAVVEQFLATRPGYSVEPPSSVAGAAGVPALTAHRSVKGHGIQLSPHRTETDGFYVAILKHAA